jgi:hypothetical protein
MCGCFDTSAVRNESPSYAVLPLYLRKGCLLVCPFPPLDGQSEELEVACITDVCGGPQWIVVNTL